MPFAAVLLAATPRDTAAKTMCAFPLSSGNDLVLRDKVEALDLKFVERIIVHTSTLVIEEVRQGPPSSVAAVTGGFQGLAEHSCQLVCLLSEMQRYKKNNINDKCQIDDT